MWEFITESGMLKNIYFTFVLSEVKDDWLLSNQSEYSRESLKRRKHLFHEIENSTETSSRIKALIH